MNDPFHSPPWWGRGNSSRLFVYYNSRLPKRLIVWQSLPMNFQWSLSCCCALWSATAHAGKVFAVSHMRRESSRNLFMASEVQSSCYFGLPSCQSRWVCCIFEWVCIFVITIEELFLIFMRFARLFIKDKPTSTSPSCLALLANLVFKPNVHEREWQPSTKDGQVSTHTNTPWAPSLWPSVKQVVCSSCTKWICAIPLRHHCSE